MQVDRFYFCYLIMWLVGSYLMGALPFGVWISRLASLGSLQTTGSGATGATNVYRIGGKIWGGLTLFLDALKGGVSVYVARHVDEVFVPPVLLFVVLGHIHSCWLRGKGGKGVATAWGGVMALSWTLGIGGIFFWAALVYITRVVSFASLGAVFFLSFALFFSKQHHPLSFCFFLMGALIFKAHIPNIKRLYSGTEPRIF